MNQLSKTRFLRRLRRRLLLARLHLRLRHRRRRLSIQMMNRLCRRYCLVLLCLCHLLNFLNL
jgi:hypothetical protein